MLKSPQPHTCGRESRRLAKILLVDDEKAILRSTRLLLQHMGHEVVATPVADQVIPLMRSERPDLLLQDVRMPGLDIHALVTAVREDPLCRDVPILLFSASVDLEHVCERTRVAGALEKPFHPDDLRERVRQALRAGASPASHPQPLERRIRAA